MTALTVSAIPQWEVEMPFEIVNRKNQNSVEEAHCQWSSSLVCPMTHGEHWLPSDAAK